MMVRDGGGAAFLPCSAHSRLPSSHVLGIRLAGDGSPHHLWANMDAWQTFHL